MDAQMKRGFLEVCVLASINRQDSYGYQIVKDVPAILNLTESTLYPLLKRLEAAGLLTTYSVEHSGRPVSYTHLPVGVADNARRLHRTVRHRTRGLGQGTRTAFDSIRRQAGARFAHQRCGREKQPVSYTHLDVYKRQCTAIR